MIEKQLGLKHYIALGIIALAVAIASIQPLELESYLLHQVGTVFMLVVLIISMKKIGINFSSFCLYLLFLFLLIVYEHFF